MIYISPVGNQPMAVINPLLAIAEQAQAPRQIHLLRTQQAKSNFKHAVDFLKTRFGEGIVHYHEVSDALEPDGRRLPAQEVVRQIAAGLKEPVFFNIAGGMNFQIAACVQNLDAQACIFTYPDFRYIHVYEFKGGALSHKRVGLPSPVDVMKIQGMACESGGRDTPNVRLLIDAAMAKNLKKPPSSWLYNVKFGGIEFDIAWNSGNTMNFLKVVTRALKFRDEENAAVLDRARTGDLYHRRIHILTQDVNLVERARWESFGKVEVYRYGNKGKTKRPDPDSMGTELLKAYGALPSAPAPPTVGEEHEVVNAPGRAGDGTTLAVFLGTTPTATVKSIWSHRPDTLLLLYTGGDTQVERLKAALLRHAGRLPVNRVIFKSVDFTGAALMRIAPPTDGRLAVNITPGIKSQAFFLARWAMEHNAEIYSLNNSNATVQAIPAGKVLRQRLPEPARFLELKGETIKSAWGGRDKLCAMEGTLEGLIRFIDLIHEDHKKIQQFPGGGGGRIEVDGALFLRRQKDLGRIEFAGENHAVNFSLEKHIWLEQLTGYMLHKCGAEDVAVSTKVRWSAATEAWLEKSKAESVHKNDYDVIAVFGGEYVMVECKSGHDKPLAAMIAQTNGLAKTLGRFTLPLLCRFNHHGPPQEQNGVWVFGHRTLTDPVGLRALIDRAFSGRRTTHRSKERQA